MLVNIALVNIIIEIKFFEKLRYQEKMFNILDLRK